MVKPVDLNISHQNKQNIIFDKNGRLNQKTITIVKVVGGIAIVAALVAGFILLQNKSPRVAVGLAGGLSITTASLKIITSFTKFGSSDEKSEAEKINDEKTRVGRLDFETFKKESQSYRISKTNHAHYYEVYVEPLIGPKAKKLNGQSPSYRFNEVQRLKVMKKANEFFPDGSKTREVFLKALAKSELNTESHARVLQPILRDKAPKNALLIT